MTRKITNTTNHENGDEMIKVHDRCGTPVSYETVSPGYTAECLECDEDLYSFEIEEISEKQFQTISQNLED